ncbi:glycoside hydrolase family 27 protein [bacterium]|nr:glycoside hydrolase family 27 protein [bacterium]
MKNLLWLLLAFCVSNASAQKFDGLAKTPPMGWNSWNKFNCDVNEAMIREIADAMVSNGMKEAGYQYINIDDCWHGERDSLGFIQVDPERFPSGMKALADYVHSKGLKFGVYSDAGWQTCAGRPGSRGYEYQDAMRYAEWGVDYLKYDFCNTEGLNAEGAYMTMRNALFKAGRPIVFSICEWGSNKPWLWGKNIGNLWRTTGDIGVAFDGDVDHGDWKSLGVLHILDLQVELRQYAGPGHWNDPDMLEVGNGLTVSEDRAHFSMWCMLAAPLISGNDLRNMPKETLEILTNKEAIAVNQDTLGIQGFKYSSNDSLETWFKPLAGGDWAVCFLNRGLTSKTVEFSWIEHPISDSLSGRAIDFKQAAFKVYDVWTHKECGKTDKTFKGSIASHDVIMLRLKPLKK